MGDAEISDLTVGFEYSLPWGPDNDYKIGGAVRSPAVVVSDYRICLRVYPRGTVRTAGSYVAAFVEIRPDDVKESWLLPDVNYEIGVQNMDDMWSVSYSDTHSFSHASDHKGWHNMIWGKSLPELSKAGWVHDGKVIFNVDVTLPHNILQRAAKRRKTTWDGSSLWEGMLFPDMVLSNGDAGTELPCHRAVLGASSEAFARMLSSSMKEGAEKRLVLPGIQKDVLRYFLEFVYTGYIPEVALEGVEQVEKMLQLADQYEFKVLALCSAKRLVAMMDVSNVSAVLRLLKTHSRIACVAACLRQAKGKLKNDESLLDAVVSNL